jgi:hypothetical protein
MSAKEPIAEPFCECGHEATSHEWDPNKPSYRLCQVSACGCPAYDFGKLAVSWHETAKSNQ